MDLLESDGQGLLSGVSGEVWLATHSIGQVINAGKVQFHKSPDGRRFVSPQVLQDLFEGRMGFNVERLQRKGHGVLFRYGCRIQDA